MSTHQWTTRNYNGKALYQFCTTHETDHGLAGLELAVEAAKERGISSGCQYPTTQQSEISGYARRHPYSGERVESSGYCVSRTCACDCHKNEAQDVIAEL